MITRCEKCLKVYNDAERWTICPHRHLDEEPSADGEARAVEQVTVEQGATHAAPVHTRPMIYLASPYAHPDAAVVEMRHRIVCRAAARLMRGGRLVFCPIAHSHHISKLGEVEGHEFWLRQDLAILERCDQLWILGIWGWEESRGVLEERRFAKARDMIVLVTPLARSDVEGEDYEI